MPSTDLAPVPYKHFALPVFTYFAPFEEKEKSISPEKRAKPTFLLPSYLRSLWFVPRYFCKAFIYIGDTGS